MGCIADVLNLSTKGLSLANYAEGEEVLGDVNWLDRGCIVEAGLAGLDIKNLVQHIYNLQKNEPTTGKDAQDETEKDKLNYLRRVILQPALKGLAAFAVAATQKYTTSFSSPQARFTATAAHSFATLMQEYSNLESGSKIEELVILTMIANLFWLAYEGKQYIAELSNQQGLRSEQGVCAGCGNQNVVFFLGCNHANCAECLRNSLDIPQGQAANMAFCRHPKCNHAFTREEFCQVSKNSPRVMRGFDVANRINPLPQPPINPLAEELANCTIAVCGQPEVPGAPVQPVPHKILGCGHACCANCLQSHIRVKFAERGTTPFHEVKCYHVGCQHQLSRNELNVIMANTPEHDQYLTEYDNRVFIQANPHNAVRRAEIQGFDLELRRQLGIRRCPHCHDLIEKDAGCNHMVCRNIADNGQLCNHHFCWICGSDYLHYRHAAHPTCPVVNGGPYAEGDAIGDWWH